MGYWQARIAAMQHALKYKGASMTGAQRDLLRKDIARSKLFRTLESADPEAMLGRSYRTRRGRRRRKIAR